MEWCLSKEKTADTVSIGDAARHYFHLPFLSRVYYFGRFQVGSLPLAGFKQREGSLLARTATLGSGQQGTVLFQVSAGDWSRHTVRGDYFTNL